MTASERHQLGFRMAATLGHERIYPINWNEGSGDLGLPFDFAREHQPELYRELTGERDGQPEDLQPDMSGVPIVDMLRELNDPHALEESHRIYLTLAQVGEGRNYVGIDWVKGWYQRNLIIFANLCRIATDPADRILVVYGSGHIPLLSQFIEDSGRFTLEPIAPYLSGD